MAGDDTSKTWLLQAAGKDSFAVQKLIMLYHPRLRSMARRKLPLDLRGKLDAEDVLQQVYIDVVRHVKDFDFQNPDAFYRWLERILHSKLIDARRHFRAAARSPAKEIAERGSVCNYESLAVRAAVDTTTPSRVAARAESKSLLLAALAGLSDDHRRILELRFLQGRPLVEVAGMMQRSPAAAQMLCARALRQLRASVQRLSALQP